MAGKFIIDVAELRRNARDHTERGAVTCGYDADREEVIEALNDALATELVCVMRYRRHHFMAQGLAARSVADEFLAHSNEELGHADLLAARIVQLNGEPDFNPNELLERSHAEYFEGNSLADMIRENLIAERIAIDSYREMIAYLGDADVTTRRLLETILATEEEHADDMSDLLVAHRAPPTPQVVSAPIAGAGHDQGPRLLDAELLSDAPPEGVGRHR